MSSFCDRRVTFCLLQRLTNPSSDRTRSLVHKYMYSHNHQQSRESVVSVDVILLLSSDVEVVKRQPSSALQRTAHFLLHEQYNNAQELLHVVPAPDQLHELFVYLQLSSRVSFYCGDSPLSIVRHQQSTELVASLPPLYKAFWWARESIERIRDNQWTSILSELYSSISTFEDAGLEYDAALAKAAVANALSGQGDPGGALEVLLAIQPTLSQYPSQPHAAANLVNIAVALQRLNDVPTARKYYIEALQVERLARPSAINCTILHNLALLEKTAGEYEQARMWYERALNCARTIHNVEKEYSLLAGMVDLDLKTGDLERAVAGLVEVDDAVLSTLSVACRAIVTSARWKQAFARGDMEAAEQAFEQAIGLTREFRRRDDTMKLLREYLDLYGSSAPAERLLPLSQELITLQDELQRDTAASVPRSVEVRLAQQQAIRELELNKEREKLDVSIAAREQTVREVGAVLHDDVGQSLTVIGLQVDNLLRSGGLPAATLHEVTQVRSQLRRLTEHVRELSHALSAQHLETAGLGAALLTLAEEVRSAGVDVQCVTWGETGIGERGEERGEEGGKRVDNRVSLSPEVRLCLYRCAQTALQNALRHGEATSIELQLGVLDDETMVSVNDNGRGFDQSVTSFGLGLRDAMNRIERLGGTVYIDSRPGRGTFVKFTIPHSGA